MDEKKSKQHEMLIGQDKTSIVRYGAILIDIHTRLVIEGYFLKGGKIWNIFKVCTPICAVAWED